MGALVLAFTLIGAAMVLFVDQDAGLSEAAVLVDLRRHLAAFAKAETVVRVALLKTFDAEETIPSIESVLRRERRLTWQTVDAESIRDGVLRDFDVLIVPGGRGSVKAQELEATGRLQIMEFVRDGGGYVGICGGSFLAASGQDWGLGLVGSRPLSGPVACGAKGTRQMIDRGAGMVSIRFSSPGRGLFSGLAPETTLRYTSGPIFGSGFGNDLPDFVVLARYTTEISECDLQRHTMVHRPAIISARYGQGHVILFSPHPEMTPQTEHLLIEAVASCAKPGTD